MKIESQEIIRYSLFLYFVTSSRRRVKLDVGLLEVFVDVHDRSHVATSVTIVRCREDSADILVVGARIPLNILLDTSIISWWARAIILRLLVWLNCSAMSWPKVQPAPRGFMPHPARSSGSDQTRSHIGPSWGTSWNLLRVLMLSKVSMLGESPPCKQKN